MKYNVPVLFMIWLLTNTSLFAQSIFTIRQLQLLDSISTQDVPPSAPGIATAIIKDGKVVYEKYAGYADLGDSTLINKSTRFNIASNGKQFTALAILSLIQNKKLKLSDDIRTFFPALFPKIKHRITIQSLLNHTSGIRDCYDLWSLQGYTWWKKSFSNNDVLKLMEQQEDLNFIPNTKYLYSNTNYILLALLIEKVSGKSFVEYTNSMFGQLNMPNTSFEADYTKIRGPIARAYFNFGTWTTYNWIWNVCGDGNIFSTLEDQIEWEKIIQRSASAEVSASVIKKSQTNMKGSSFKNYGYGLEFGNYKGLSYTFHEGATGAWKATVTRFPAQKTSIITLTNTGKSIPSMQTRQMADIVFDLKPDNAYIRTKPYSIGKFVSENEVIGTYFTESDFAFQFIQKDNKLFLRRSGRNDVELEREAANIFRQKFDTLFKQEFTTGADGRLLVTAYYINHAPYTLIKQSETLSGFNFHSLDGFYSNTETGAKLEIHYRENNQYKISIAGEEYTTNAFLLTPEKLMAENYTISFEVNDGTVNAIYLNGDRIKNIKFIRLKQPIK